jgi:hypothetical protein
MSAMKIGATIANSIAVAERASRAKRTAAPNALRTELGNSDIPAARSKEIALAT